MVTQSSQNFVNLRFFVPLCCAIKVDLHKLLELSLRNGTYDSKFQRSLFLQNSVGASRRGFVHTEQPRRDRGCERRFSFAVWRSVPGGASLRPPGSPHPIAAIGQAVGHAEEGTRYPSSIG